MLGTLDRLAPRAGLLLVALAALIGFLLVPVQPAYDTAYALIWGHELANGRLPVLDAYRAPTQHPLTMLLGVLVAPLPASVGGQVTVFLALTAYVALVAGIFRLSRVTFGPVVAWAAAALLVSRLDYASLAIRAYLDIPYLAFLIWAAALEAQRSRRGGPVWVLLIAAGLLRPEAWLLSGLYALWVVADPEALRGARSPRALVAALPRDWRVWRTPVLAVATAPVVWFTLDLLLTGSPIFSLTYTSGSAAALGHRVPLTYLPESIFKLLSSLTKPPVLLAGVVGLGLALRLAPRRAAVPTVLLVTGLVTFLLIAFAGLAVVGRYLAVPALMVLLFAAVTMGGFTLLPRGTRERRIWAIGSAVAFLSAVGFTATHLSFSYIRTDLEVRRQVPRHLDALLDRPEVLAARRCGPFIVPNQKLVADVRMATRAPAGQVRSRSEIPDRVLQTRGVFIQLVHPDLRKHPAYRPFEQSKDRRDVNTPPPGFVRIGGDAWFGLYAAC